MVSSATLFNRMVAGIALRVRAFVAWTWGVHPIEARSLSEIEPSKAELLIVGRQHLSSNGTLIYAADVLLDAVTRARPRLCLYVVPATLDPAAHRSDLDAIAVAARLCPVYVLEFAVLHELSAEEAAARAARTLSLAPGSGSVPRLLQT